MKIKPYEKNAKKHPKKQLDQLAKVVKEVGWRQPVVVNQHGVIVVGHGRWETYEKNKESLKEIWVIDDTGKTIMGAPETIPLTKDQEMMWRLADNKLNESDWDMGLVTEELKLLSPEMIDLSGFKRDIILQSTEDEYDVENGLKNEVRVNKGDIWKLGIHRLMCGDSTKKDDVGRLMDGKKADMVFTDPPYNIAGESKNFASDVSKAMMDLKKSEWDVSFDIFDVTPILQEFTSNDSTSYIFTSHFLFGDLYSAYKDWADFVSYCVWNKPNPMPSLSKRHWTFNTELCLYATKGKWICNFPDGEHALSGWIFTKKSDGSHPTQKPLEVCQHAIKMSSTIDQIVLDLFGGSGSTLIACEQTDRSCYMMELDPKYCTVILDRWEKLTGKKAEKIWQDQL